MRRLLPIFVSLLVLGAFGWTLYFLYQKSKEKPVKFETESVTTMAIIRKTVAAGAIVPRREVAIKPRVSGVLEKLYVEPGKLVKAGELVAKIKIIPNVVNVNTAEARVQSARISAENARGEFERLKALFAERLISQSDYNRAELELQLTAQELEAATDNLQLVKEGAIRGSGKVSNLVRATVSGMVIEVPVKEGASVTEANTFNEGSTIAAIADMGDLIFQGFVDESEVSKLKEGMPVSIAIGAIQDDRYEGKLEYISPKGVDREGTIEFEVRAAVTLKKGPFVRANYSANADIILERKQSALAIREALVSFDKKTAFVEVETAPQQFERREVTLGLSDGIHVEVTKGLPLDARLKVPKPLGE